MHGPVRWFLGHSFESMNKEAPLGIDAPSPPSAIPEVEKAKAKMGSKTQEPIPVDKLPTIAKLLTSVPRSVFMFYVMLSSGVTFCMCLVLYLGLLKPAIIAQYRKQK